MFASFHPGLLSLNVSPFDAIDLAARHGFDGVDLDGAQLLKVDPGELRDALSAAGLRAGYLSLPPGRVPESDANWERATADLPEIARRAQRVGFQRAALVCLPFHETFTFSDDTRDRRRRLEPVAAILRGHGVALGLEYVSPLTRRAPYANHFVHDLAGMLDFLAGFEVPVGLMLDSFHWHAANETVEQIAGLSSEQIVVVHVNDAPPVPREELTVLERAFPGDTGVIDLEGFFGALRSTGFDGPVTCEPMAAAIHALGDANADAIAEKTIASMRRVVRTRLG